MQPGHRRRAPWRARALPAVLVGALALLLPVTGAVAQLPATPALTTSPPAATAPATEDASPDATPSVDPGAVPKNVLSWFATQGLEVAQGGAAELGTEGAALDVSSPHPVAHWEPAFVDGTDTATATTASDQWVAAVTREGEEGPEAVGAIRATPLDSADPAAVVVADPGLGQALLPEELPFILIHDPGGDGWFATAEGEVWPLTTAARTVLQGPVPLTVFQQFIGEPGATPSPAPDAQLDEAADSGLVPLTVIAVIVLLGGVVAWLLVRDYRRTDSRIEADVRAGLTPFEGIALLDHTDDATGTRQEPAVSADSRPSADPPPSEGPATDGPATGDRDTRSGRR